MEFEDRRIRLRGLPSSPVTHVCHSLLRRCCPSSAYPCCQGSPLSSGESNQTNYRVHPCSFRKNHFQKDKMKESVQEQKRTEPPLQKEITLPVPLPVQAAEREIPAEESKPIPPPREEKVLTESSPVTMIAALGSDPAPMKEELQPLPVPSSSSGGVQENNLSNLPAKEGDGMGQGGSSGGSSGNGVGTGAGGARWRGTGEASGSGMGQGGSGGERLRKRGGDRNGFRSGRWPWRRFSERVRIFCKTLLLLRRGRWGPSEVC